MLTASACYDTIIFNVCEKYTYLLGQHTTAGYQRAYGLDEQAVMQVAEVVSLRDDAERRRCGRW